MKQNKVVIGKFVGRHVALEGLCFLLSCSPNSPKDSPGCWPDTFLLSPFYYDSESRWHSFPQVVYHDIYILKGKKINVRYALVTCCRGWKITSKIAQQTTHG